MPPFGAFWTPTIRLWRMPLRGLPVRPQCSVVRSGSRIAAGLPGQQSSGIEGLFQYDQHTYLPALLQRQDRMSMAAGVEARVVFLSHRLVEWANRQPTRVKVSKEGTKLPLRALIRKILPMFPVDRPKVGFTLPLAEWMAPGGSLAPSINALTSANSFVGDWLDHRAIAGMATSAQGRKAQTDMLWTLLALEEWGSTFLGGAPAPLELPGAHSSLLLPAPVSYTHLTLPTNREV